MSEEAGLKLRLRFYARAGRPDPQDLLDGAALCEAQGRSQEAQLLRDAGRLALGFSPQLRAAFGGEAPGPGKGGVERALAEAAKLGRTLGPALARATAKGIRRDDTAPHPHLTSLSLHRTSDGAGQGFAVELRAVVQSLDSPSGDTVGAFATALDGLRGAVSRALAIDLRTLAGAPMELLALGAAMAGVQAFLQDTHDLFLPPLGSPALLHATARLDSWGLGPYLANVGQVARRARDVFELAHLATEAAEQVGADTGLQPWLAILSRRLKDGLLLEMVDEFGDRAMILPLAAVLERAVHGPDEALALRIAYRVRDTALDLLDYGLASRAQQTVLQLGADPFLERLVLAGIDASGGRRAAAEQNFLACIDLALESGDEAMLAEVADIRLQLDAVRSRTFAPFAVRQGFASPADRQDRRLRARQGAPSSG